LRIRRACSTPRSWKRLFSTSSSATAPAIRPIRKSFSSSNNGVHAERRALQCQGDALSSENQPGDIGNQGDDDRYDQQKSLAGDADDICALGLKFFSAVLDTLRALELFLDERELFALHLQRFLLAFQLKFLAVPQLLQQANHSQGFVLVHGWVG